MMPLAPFAASAVFSAGKALSAKMAQGLQATAGAGAAGASGDPKTAKAKKTAAEFETMFLEQSLDKLAASEGTEGPLGENGHGGGVYRSMLTKQYAGEIVKSGGVGIGDQIYREMLRMQETGGAAAGGAARG